LKKKKLTSEQEDDLAEHLQQMAHIGYGYQRGEIINLASDFFNCIDNNNSRLSKQWYQSFMLRNPNLSLLQPSSLEAARARCVNENNIKDYFNKVELIKG
jgi:hypothetical protein